MPEGLEPLSPVVTGRQARDIAKEFGTPTYAYSQALLEQQAAKALAFPNAFGLTVRYAMKAWPNLNALRIFNNKGLRFDCSSGYEAKRMMKAGIKGKKALLTAQEIPDNLQWLVDQGVEYNACSAHQLREYGKLFPESEVTVRINPGLGSGGTNRTNTGGLASSFGKWHEQLGELLEIAETYGLNIKRVHTHIGSGSDPEIWQKVALMSLDNVERVLDSGHDVRTLNLGGGYKVGRMSYEKSTDLQECGEPVKQAFIDFAQKKGRELYLEIEPGTFLVANAGCLISRVIDVVSTPEYKFIKVDAGLTEVTRTALYGAQHPASIVSSDRTSRETGLYIIVGHECESGSILTPAEGDPEALQPRRLLEAKIGDLLVVGATGAYCSGMNLKNYNSFPEATEVLITKSGKLELIRRRQTLEQIAENEIEVIR